MRGGNALAGWSNTRAPVVTPRLKVIMVTFNDDESLVKKFNDWITAVMSLEIVDFIIDKKSDKYIKSDAAKHSDSILSLPGKPDFLSIIKSTISRLIRKNVRKTSQKL